jgi:hypothetical protein
LLTYLKLCKKTFLEHCIFKPLPLYGQLNRLANTQLSIHIEKHPQTHEKFQSDFVSLCYKYGSTAVRQYGSTAVRQYSSKHFLKPSDFIRTLLLMFAFTFGCTKDKEFKQEPKQDLQTFAVGDRTSAFSPCAYPAPLCERISQIYARLNGNQGGEGTFEILVGQQKYQAIAFKASLNDNESSSLFMVKKDSEVVVVKYEPDAQLASFSQSNLLPPQFRNLTALKNLPLEASPNVGSYSSLIPGSSTSMIAGKQVLNLSNVTPITGGDFMPVVYCDFRQVSNVQSFISEFVYAGVSDPALLTSLVTSAYQNANCAPPATSCNKCIDTRCVINNLLAVSSTQLSD